MPKLNPQGYADSRCTGPSKVGDCGSGADKPKSLNPKGYQGMSNPVNNEIVDRNWHGEYDSRPSNPTQNVKG